MPDPTTAPLVRVERLTKVFLPRRGRGWGLDRRASAQRIDRGDGPGIHDVSFEIAEGETLGLVGRSGAGKTTLGRVVLRLIPPTSGRVWVRPPDGALVDLATLSTRDLRAFRRHMQLIGQDPFGALNPRMTVQQLVAEPLQVHHLIRRGITEARTRVLTLLELVGLDRRHADLRRADLSGGEQQRVNIARAIATGPRFIVADEPVTALDVSVQAQILNLLKDVQQALRLSYLFVSHDVAVVEQMADRIAVMDAGRIVEIGPTARIIGAPEHAATRALSASYRDAPDAVRAPSTQDH